MFRTNRRNVETSLASRLLRNREPVGLHLLTEQGWLRISIALAIGSIPGVLLAYYVVKQLPLTWLRWLVVLVVVYAACTMLRSFWVGRAVKRGLHMSEIAET